MPDTAGRRMNQDALPACQSTMVEDALPGGQRGKRDRCAAAEVERGGKCGECAGIDFDELRIRALTLSDEPINFLPRFPVRRVRAFDQTREIPSRRERQL